VLLVRTVYSVLYSEVALSRKEFGIGHKYIYTLLLRMTDTMASQNTDLSSWDILYIHMHISLDCLKSANFHASETRPVSWGLVSHAICDCDYEPVEARTDAASLS
jgi:hypothetical protein